jgi:hypothetical protein
MASFTIFECLADDIAEGVHTFSTDQLAVALTNSAPTAGTDDELADISEITYTNLSSRNITTSSSTQTSGTYSLVVADLTLTASGSVGPFRYAVIYNDDAANDELIGYYDYGSSISLSNGETFKLDFGASLFTLAIS